MLHVICQITQLLKSFIFLKKSCFNIIRKTEMSWISDFDMVPPVNVHVHNYYTSGGHLCGFFGHSSFQYLNHLKCTCIYSLVATALPLLSVFCIYIPYLECLLFNMFLVFKNSYFVCTDMVLMMFIKQKLLRPLFFSIGLSCIRKM